MSSPTDCELRPNLGRATILIAEGQYQETLNITRKGPLTLLVCLCHLAECASHSSRRANCQLGPR